MRSSADGQVYRVGAKFEVAENSRPGVVRVEEYDVDIPSGRVTRHASAAP